MKILSYKRQPFRVVLLASATILAATMMPSYAGHPTARKSSAPAAASQAAPNFPLPYTFTCPHCSMKITIKTPADWNKDCLTCACGVSNLGCYHEKKK